MLTSTTDIKINKVSEEGDTGVFTFEPLPMGFGHTLGNTLRRVLLTSLKGAAVTQIKIAGVPHQFSTISGVKEDVVEIGLNFKRIRAKIYSDNPVVGKISKSGEGKVTAKDIDISSEVEILNKDQHIATLSDSKSKFDIELVIEPGVGYSPVEERETSKIGVILLDAVFSPVLKVDYAVEPTRMGGTIGLDKLTLEITTDGSITPSEALTEAATILRNFFNRFAAAEDEEPKGKVSEEEKEGGVMDDVAVEDLPLPTRTINALKKAKINTLKELASKTDEDLSDVKNLGEKSLEEIKKLLKKEGSEE